MALVGNLTAWNGVMFVPPMYRETDQFTVNRRSASHSYQPQICSGITHSSENFFQGPINVHSALHSLDWTEEKKNTVTECRHIL